MKCQRLRVACLSRQVAATIILVTVIVCSLLVRSDRMSSRGARLLMALRLSQVSTRLKASNVMFANKTCDYECSRFRHHVDSWPSDRPRAAVVILLRLESFPFFRRSINLFHDNFNSDYRYPIIVFHEADLDTKLERHHFRASAPDPKLLFFQRVTFNIPSFVNLTAVPRFACSTTVGYRHMCRFHAKTIYDEPILDGLRYVWRLDDDSYIMHPVGYDVFRLMADRRIRYGYVRAAPHGEECIEGLWSAADRYIEEHGLRRKFQLPRRNDVYSNNFEVSDLELWKSREYSQFFDYIDRLGGIYYKRWGDHAIKTIAVTLFVPYNETRQFSDIAYTHGR